MKPLDRKLLKMENLVARCYEMFIELEDELVTLDTARNYLNRQLTRNALERLVSLVRKEGLNIRTIPKRGYVLDFWKAKPEQRSVYVPIAFPGECPRTMRFETGEITRDAAKLVAKVVHLLLNYQDEVSLDQWAAEQNADDWIKAFGIYGYVTIDEYESSQCWRNRAKEHLAWQPFCVDCGVTVRMQFNEGRILAVHHARYDNIGDERQQELVTKCDICHSNTHDRRDARKVNLGLEVTKK